MLLTLALVVAVALMRRPVAGGAGAGAGTARAVQGARSFVTLRPNPDLGSAPTSANLNNHHRDTLEEIDGHPASGNVEWRKVLSLLEAVADGPRSTTASSR